MEPPWCYIFFWLLVGVGCLPFRPSSILVSRLNYGVWAFSSPDTDAQIIGLGDPLIPIKVI